MSAIYDANEYLIAGLENQAEWWEHLGDAHRDYAALAREAVALQQEIDKAWIGAQIALCEEFIRAADNDETFGFEDIQAKLVLLTQAER